MLQVERDEAAKIVFHMPMLLNLRSQTLQDKFHALADTLGLSSDAEEVG